MKYTPGVVYRFDLFPARTFDYLNYQMLYSASAPTHGDQVMADQIRRTRKRNRRRRAKLVELKRMTFDDLDDLRSAYGNPPTFHGMLGLIGVQVNSAGRVHWFGFDSKNVLVYRASTIGPGLDFMDLEVFE